ncbi:MAG TPA: DUF3565 domain-containing protein [Acidimicrobiales bacterium]|jgi:tellurite resistance-related uncharacterized protein|nr:DUF3565 domain-containing protein [Acidimicrobiales bacterium]
MVQRAITGYHQDDVADWVAELACGHNQHVRHRPPFQEYPWVTTAEGRTERVGRPLDCPLCDRAEMPDAVRPVRTTDIWDQDSLPAGLRRAHRVAASTWGRIIVHEGVLRFAAGTDPPIEADLVAGASQPIPPEVEHQVTPLGDVRFQIEFLKVER